MTNSLLSLHNWRWLGPRYRHHGDVVRSTSRGADTDVLVLAATTLQKRRSNISCCCSAVNKGRTLRNHLWLPLRAPLDSFPHSLSTRKIFLVLSLPGCRVTWSWAPELRDMWRAPEFSGAFSSEVFFFAVGCRGCFAAFQRRPRVKCLEGTAPGCTVDFLGDRIRSNISGEDILMESFPGRNIHAESLPT